MSISPLNIHVRMVNEEGQPTPEFMRWWQEFLVTLNPLSVPGGVSNLIDVLGDTWGAILVREETGWTLLPPSTSGQALLTQGVDADPVWGTPTVTFVSMPDTPSTYSGQALKNVRVNAAEDGLEFTAGGGTFVSLTDTPASFTGNSLLSVRVNAGETALEYYTPATGVTAFTGLSDTPGALGAALQLVRMNAGGTALEFSTPPTVVTAFTGLSDTPGSLGTALQQIRVNAGATALEFFTASSASTFVGLSDTPANFTGSALLFARVNAGETALEFVAGGGGAAAFTDLSDTPGTLGTAGQIPAVNAGATALEWVDAASGGGGGGLTATAMALIGTGTASGSYITYEGDLDYTKAEIYFNDVKVDTNAQFVRMQIKVNGAWVATGYDGAARGYINTGFEESGNSVNAASWAIQALAANYDMNDSNTTYDSMSGRITFADLQDGDYTSAHGLVQYPPDYAANVRGIFQFGGIQRAANTGAVEGIRLFIASGNITGNLEVWAPTAVGISAGDGTENVVQMTETIFDLSDVGNTLDAGNEIELDITDAFMVVLDMNDGAAGSSTRANVQLSTDDGATWLTTSGDYQRWLSNETTAQHSLNDVCFFFNADGTAELGGQMQLVNMNRDDKKTGSTSINVGSTEHYQTRSERKAATIENRLRLTSNTGSAFTAGIVVAQVYKRVTTAPPVVTGDVTVTRETTVLLDNDFGTTAVSSGVPLELLTDLTEYDELQIYVEVTTGGRLGMEFSPDGGSTWRTNTYSRMYVGTTIDFFDNSNQSNIVLADGSGSAGYATIRHAATADMPTFADVQWSSGTGTVYRIVDWQDRLEVANALRLVHVSGSNITAGNIKIVGVKNVGSASVVATAYNAPYDVGSGFSDVPTTAQVLEVIMIARELVFPANFAGSVGDITTNPTGSFVIDVDDDGVTIGTITISTGGAFTFATTSGTAKTVAAGSKLEFIAPVSVDATAAGAVWTLLGTSGVTP